MVRTKLGTVNAASRAQIGAIRSRGSRHTASAGSGSAWTRSDRLPELADRGVAGLRIEQPRREPAIYDVVAHDRASRLVVVDHARRDTGVPGAPLDLEALPPCLDRLALARDLEHVRMPRRLDAVHARARQPRGDPRDRRRRAAEVVGQTRFERHARIIAIRTMSSRPYGSRERDVQGVPHAAPPPPAACAGAAAESCFAQPGRPGLALQ